MKITKIYCDLCGSEITDDQGNKDYFLPFSKKAESKSIWPTKYNLCTNCANLIKETCECIKAEADLRG